MSSHFFILTTQLNGNLGGCQFGLTEDGQPGYKKAGADTVYPFSGSVQKVSGTFYAYLPAGLMNCYTRINKQENADIKKLIIQINRTIAGQTYIRIISNKDSIPTTIMQYALNSQPAINEDIEFNISDSPDNIEIEAQTIQSGVMQGTTVQYTVEFG